MSQVVTELRKREFMICAVTGRYLMRKNNFEKAKRASAFAIWGCFSVTLLYCLGVQFFCDRFINILGGTDPYVHSKASEYMKCAIVAGGVATSLSTLLSHLIRAYGCSIQASVGVAIGGILNIILDPVFMFQYFR